MKHQHPTHPEPTDAQARRARPVVVCYPTETLPQLDLVASAARREGAELLQRLSVPPRSAACIDVPAGHFARIVSVEGPQERVVTKSFMKMKRMSQPLIQ